MDPRLLAQFENLGREIKALRVASGGGCDVVGNPRFTTPKAMIPALRDAASMSRLVVIDTEEERVVVRPVSVRAGDVTCEDRAGLPVKIPLSEILAVALTQRTSFPPEGGTPNYPFK